MTNPQPSWLTLWAAGLIVLCALFMAVDLARHLMFVWRSRRRP